MIREYFRPQSIEEALNLLAKTDIDIRPLAGGTVLNRPDEEKFSVVDLQALGLNTIAQRGNFLDIGATTTLQALLEYQHTHPVVQRVVQLEATYNLRQVGTVAGTLLAADGRSPFATLMLALDARLTLLPGEHVVELGELLLTRPSGLRGKLVTSVSIPVNVRLAYQSVARTPADWPIVCAAVCMWPSGRTRVALGGYGKSPLMAMDGPETGGVADAARSAYQDAGDEWASASYRSDIAATLANRAMAEIFV